MSSESDHINAMSNSVSEDSHVADKEEADTEPIRNVTESGVSKYTPEQLESIYAGMLVSRE